MRFVRVSVLVLGILAPAVAGAQSLGAFRWQLQPYCNVVTVNVTREGGVYRLEGTDDLCGAGSAASAVGTAFVNPDASVGFGLTIVPAPNGSPVHIGATIQLSTLSGTWRDSAGHGGAFVPTPGAAAPGDPRPATTLGLSGVSLGFGLSQSGSPGDVSVGVDLDAVKSAIGLRQSLSGGLGLGDRALAEAGTDAYANTAVGNGALQSTSTGDFNTALGDGALRGNTTGRGNVAVGGFALRANIDGEDNTAVGVSALERSVINSGNTALGSGALFRLELGRNNIAIGQQAGFHLIAGSYNTYLGSTGANLDNYTVRIGYNDPGSRTFIAGIRGRTTAVANAVPVVIDSADWLERLVWDVLCEQYGVTSIEKVDGGYARGYTHALTHWRKLLADLNTLRTQRGMCVILLAHAKVEKFEDPEASAYDRYSPRLHKHAAALITEWCDAVLFATRKFTTRSEDAGFGRQRAIAAPIGAGGGERILRTSGGPTCVAKNRYGLPPELPLSWDAIIAGILGSITPSTNDEFNHSTEGELIHG